jgi:hypothetical protein
LTVAVYNEILAGRYNRMLQKLFGMKGGAPAPSLAGDIQPSFPLFAGAELRFLESWDRFGFFAAFAAGGAGNRSAVRLRNPLGSNTIAILEKIVYNNNDLATSTAQFSYTALRADLTSPQAVSAFDSRGRPGSTCVPSGQNLSVLAISGTIIHQLTLPTNGSQDIIFTDIQELPLLPGNEFNVWDLTVNQALAVTIWWRERALEESERT